MGITKRLSGVNQTSLFISLTPESMHMVMWIMSDRSILRSFRFMEGFGVHTFCLINAAGKSIFVKFLGNRSSACNRWSGTKP